MPYKSHADFVQWNRNYQRQRSAQERAHTADLEDRILRLVKESPGQLDLRALYERLRPEGYPITAVRKALTDLTQGGLIRCLRPGEPGYPQEALTRNQGSLNWEPPPQLLVLTKPWRGSEGQECPRSSTTMSNASLPDTKS